MRTAKKQKVRIRQNSLVRSRYLKRDGTWGEWKDAAKFSTQDAAEAFAKKKGVDDYGLFSYDVG